MANPLNITVRPALHTDTEGVLAADPVGRSERLRTNRLYQAISSRMCHVAEADGKVVGYGVLEYSFFGHGIISLLAVHEDHRRRGVGSAIVRHLRRTCTAEKLFAVCGESNGDACEMFRNCGMVESGRMDNVRSDEPQILWYAPKDL